MQQTTSNGEPPSGAPHFAAESGGSVRLPSAAPAPEAAEHAPDTPVRRLAVLAVAIGISALAFRAAVPFVGSERGVIGPLLSDAGRPALAAVAVLLAFVVSLAVAALVGRLVNAVVGIFVLGTGVGFLAMRSGSAEDFAFGGSSVVASGVEMLVWAVLVAAASHLVFRVGGTLPDMPPTYDDAIDSPVGREARTSWAAVLGGLAVCWLAVASMSKGQAIGAATLCGFATAAVARLIAPRTPPVYLAAVPVLALGLIVLGLGLTGSGDLATRFVAGTYPRFLAMMPFDVVAGSLCGTALGFGFMRSFATPAGSQA